MPRSLILVVLASACAPDLRKTDCFDGVCGELPTEPLFSFTVKEGVVEALVDATSKTLPTYIDLDEPKELKFDEAEATNAWDLSFMRDKVRANGGGTNPTGVVEVAVLTGQSFGALTQAPASGYLKDGSEGVFNTVEGGWYFYDLGVHRLTTLDHLYVVKTSKGGFFKVKMGSYYDGNGTAARIAVTFAKLLPP
ncbi:MAG: HmuY family protein [Myxococcaceae bacterium]|nr:HmuY family protein [Myxococcaceae bacterium]